MVNKNKRLRWAKENRHWTEEYWKKVLRTDESKFEVFGLQRRTFVRRRKNKKDAGGVMDVKRLAS